MRISSNELHNVVSAYIRRVEHDPKAKGAKNEKASGKDSDSVSLSDRARELSRLRVYLGQLPDVRAERVNELKQQIQSGEYRVSGKDIAEKMLERSLADRLATAAETE